MRIGSAVTGWSVRSAKPGGPRRAVPAGSVHPSQRTSPVGLPVNSRTGELEAGTEVPFSGGYQAKPPGASAQQAGTHRARSDGVPFSVGFFPLPFRACGVRRRRSLRAPLRGWRMKQPPGQKPRASTPFFRSRFRAPPISRQ